MLSILRTSLLLALLAASGAARADVEALVRQAEAKQLASHPYWSALLHYRRGTLAGVTSEIRSQDFFLAPQGSSDPQAELRATLAAMLEPAGAAPDEHAQCRFPARHSWLRKALDWGAVDAPSVACPQYRRYTHGGQVESLSLVYATGYLSNPASFFGHILLKLNTRRSVLPSELLDYSLNFGAAVPPNENGLVYVLKGLFGGYDAFFTHQQFYNFNHAYAENELRDLWEYELALTPDEVEQLVAHSWELLGRNYAYFFLKENCAYRMDQLLALVLGEPLLPDVPWSLPAVVFDRLAQVQRNGVPVVREVRRLPSRQSRFRERYAVLGPDARVATRALAERVDLEDPRYTSLDTEGKIAAVDTLLDYYEYRAVLERRSGEPQAARQALLRERARLPARRLAEERSPPASRGTAPPHEGPLWFTLRAGPVHNSRLGDGVALRVRPAGYDPLSLDASRIPHSELAMFDLTVVRLRERWRLRRLDLISVGNLNLAPTPLPEDGGAMWSFRAGLESQDLQCERCTVLGAKAEWGRAMPLGSRFAAWAALEGSVQTRHAGSGSVAATPRLGLVAAPLEGWKLAASAGRRKFFDGTRRGERVARVESRFGTSRKWDVRLSYERHAAHETQAAVSLYW